MPTKVPVEFVGQYVATREARSFKKGDEVIAIPAKLSILCTNVEGEGGAELFEVPTTPLEQGNIEYAHLAPMDWIQVRGVAVLPDRGEDRPGRLVIYQLKKVSAPAASSPARQAG